MVKLLGEASERAGKTVRSVAALDVTCSTISHASGSEGVLRKAVMSMRRSRDDGAMGGGKTYAGECA